MTTTQTNHPGTVDHETSTGWLQPMLDELGIPLAVVVDVLFQPDRIVITCVHTTDSEAEFPPAQYAGGQLARGLADDSQLLYRVELTIDGPPVEEAPKTTLAETVREAVRVEIRDVVREVRQAMGSDTRLNLKVRGA